MFRRLVKWSAISFGAIGASLALLLVIGLSLSLDPIPQFGSRPQAVVIENITLVDVGQGVHRQNQSVLIENGRISMISASDVKTATPDALIIDGRGKYLIPGLWDAHVHTLALSDRLHFPLMLAQGITSMRNMGDGCSWGTDLDCVTDKAQWQVGSRAPHIAATAGYHIEELQSPGDAPALVKALKARGDDIIKIQLDGESDPDSSIFEAIVKASGENNIAATGHLPPTAKLTDPVYNALYSVEHDTQLMPHCSASEPAKCDSLLATLAQRGTAYVPTHVASSGQDIVLSKLRANQDGLLDYVSSALSAVWQFYRFFHRTGTDDANLAEFDRIHREALNLTLKAHRAGVPVLAGTDALDPFVLHGVALHDELGFLARAGLTPAEALNAATKSSAETLGMEGETGQVEIGQRADLVLLTGDPLADIAATRSVDTVIANGVVYGPKDRAKMTDFVKRQAASLAVGARSWSALLGFTT